MSPGLWLTPQLPRPLIMQTPAPHPIAVLFQSRCFQSSHPPLSQPAKMYSPLRRTASKVAFLSTASKNKTLCSLLAPRPVSATLVLENHSGLRAARCRGQQLHSSLYLREKSILSEKCIHRRMLFEQCSFT